MEHLGNSTGFLFESLKINSTVTKSAEVAPSQEGLNLIHGETHNFSRESLRKNIALAFEEKTGLHRFSSLVKLPLTLEISVFLKCGGLRVFY